MMGVLKENAGADMARSSRPALEPGQEALLQAMGYDPIDIDSLVERSGLTPEAISSMLLWMELEGLVEASPGGTYQRIGNALAQ